MLRFTISAIQKSERKNKETFFPTFMPGKYSQASIHKVLDPSAEELNPPGGIAKDCPREYSHTSHGCTRGHLKKGEELERHQKILESEMGCCLFKQKQKLNYEKILSETICIKNKLKMRQRVNHNFKLR